MASSKKYGYQLRGEKLALCELDITGTGDGLNYSYTDNAGLDIATDPSAWKSPITTVADGLQIEYLSNEFSLGTIYGNETEIYDAIPVDSSQMNDIDYIHNYQQAQFDLFSQTLSNPIVHEQVSNALQSNGNAGNVLKISRLKTVVTSPTAVSGIPAYLTFDTFALNKGTRYRFSMDAKFNCALNGVSSPYYMIMTVGDSLVPAGGQTPGAFGGIDGSFSSGMSAIGVIQHPDSPIFDSFNTPWTSMSYDFIAPEEYITIVFQFPEMSGTVGDDRYIYLDNLKIAEIELGSIDLIEAEIELPSYAQKALLDYVRAQESYEGGDLEKWDFFMKQFRSKLERWEDSRITGPRVLGPSSSSIT